jgi:hypothetical protein
MPMSLWQIFKPVIAIGLLSGAGLLSALLADGFWDGLSWACLAWVGGLGVYYSLRRNTDL